MKNISPIPLTFIITGQCNIIVEEELAETFAELIIKL